MKRIFNNSKLTSIRKQLRNHCTQAEMILWSYLRRNQLGVKFRRQYGVGRYIIDFYCTQLKLGIELDGKIHIRQDVAEYDAERTIFLEAAGITLMRFDNDDVLISILNALTAIKLQIQSIKSTQS
jgi:very-short-patch-repair endonuclease